jgi:nucleotide-binding universal stress UspA family protein
MQKILVATDLSSRAARACDRALLLAESHKASVVLLHVVDEDLPEAIVENELRQARDYLMDTHSSRADSLGVVLEIRAIAGAAHEAIPETARRGAADLVVLGAHRRRLLRDIFVGTTAERVIRSSTSPVLMVNRAPEGRYRSVVAGVDFSPTSCRALVTAKNLGLLEEVRLAVVHGFIPLADGVMRYAGIEEDQDTGARNAERARGSEADVRVPLAPRAVFPAARGVGRAGRALRGDRAYV